MEETTNNTNINTDGIVQRPRRKHAKPSAKHDTLFKIRQILNLLFIVIGIIGAAITGYGQYALQDERTKMMGIVIVVIAMAMKMAECVLRFMSPKKETDQEE